MKIECNLLLNHSITNFYLNMWNRGLTFLNLNTDFSERSHPVIETRYSPLSNSDSPQQFNRSRSQKCSKKSQCSAFFPTLEGSCPENRAGGMSQSHLELALAQTSSPITISTSTETDDDEGFISRSRSGSASTAGSPVFSKIISGTWSYSRNSSPVDAHKPTFFDDSIIDEIGRRRRSSFVKRAEREVRLGDESHEVFGLSELKINLHAAKLRQESSRVQLYRMTS